MTSKFKKIKKDNLRYKLWQNQETFSSLFKIFMRACLLFLTGKISITNEKLERFLKTVKFFLMLYLFIFFKHTFSVLPPVLSLFYIGHYILSSTCKDRIEFLKTKHKVRNRKRKKKKKKKVF